MLTIGVVTAGGLGYYLDTVGSGVDDYYVRSDAGFWTGAGSAALGLSGDVDGDQIDSVATRHHPLSGAALGGRPGKVAAFDLTFSAPKSVSVMAGLGSPEVREAVEAAHHRAVGEALSLIERDALRGRRGKAGLSQVETTGAVAAGFTHRSSRAGDPQLHTHLLVVNGALGVNGRWGGVHGRRIFGWAKTAGFVYQAALRAELTDRLGVEWSPVRNGSAEMSAIPESITAEFSQRRAQIVAHLEESGHSSVRAAQAATLITRPAKPEPLEPAVQRDLWWERAADLGLRSDTLDAAVRAPARGAGPTVGEGPPSLIGEPPQQTDRQRQALTERLAGPAGLTAHRSTFDRRHLIESVASEATTGAHLAAIDDTVGWITGDDRVVPTGTEHSLAGPTFTTADLLAAEGKVIELANRPPANHRRECTPVALNAALARRPSLSPEQRVMISAICTSAQPVTVVIGRAGTGKTFAIDAARDTWSASGIAVIGTALAARTAQDLQAGTGIPSATVDQLLADLSRPGLPPGSVVPIGGVVVVDEAGMVGTRKLAQLLDAAAHHSAQVVLVGDPRQLPEVEAGGAFAHLAARRDTVELTTNRRQLEAWERDALAEVRHGEVPDAVTVYRDHQRITLTATAEQARDALVADWWTARRSGEAALMMAPTQADVDDLNTRARDRFGAAGGLGPETLVAAGKEYAVGDQILFLRNDRRLGLTNGQRATVTHVCPDGGLTARPGDATAPSIEVPDSYLAAGQVTHGYATTIHKAQGMTVERAFLLGSDRLTRESGYVGLSRARARTDLYHVNPNPARWEPTIDPYQRLTSQLERSNQQRLATAQLQPPPQITTTARWAIEATPSAIGEVANPVAPVVLRSQRSAELAAAALADPPDHLIERIGRPPLTGRARETWTTAATVVETYRDRYAVTGPEPLGPALPGPDSKQGRHRQLASTALHMAEEELTRTPDRDLGLGR